MAPHKARAKRNLRMAQISAAGLAALAGLILMMPASASSGSDAGSAAKPSNPGDPAPSLEAPSLDVSRAVATLSERVLKLERPAPPPTVPPKGGETSTIEIPPPPPPTAEVRYVGTVVTPRRTYAVISNAEGEKVFVAQGEQFNDLTLVMATSDRMILEDCDGNPHEYTMQPRPDHFFAEAPVNQPNLVNGNMAAKPAPELNLNQISTKDPAELERIYKASQDRAREMAEKAAAAKAGLNQPNRAPGNPNQVRPITPTKPGPANPKDLK